MNQEESKQMEVYLSQPKAVGGEEVLIAEATVARIAVVSELLGEDLWEKPNALADDGVVRFLLTRCDADLEKVRRLCGAVLVRVPERLEAVRGTELLAVVRDFFLRFLTRSGVLELLLPKPAASPESFAKVTATAASAQGALKRRV